MSETVETYFPQIADIYQAAKIIAQVAEVTPLQQSIRYSKTHGANILLKEKIFTESAATKSVVRTIRLVHSVKNNWIVVLFVPALGIMHRAWPLLVVIYK